MSEQEEQVLVLAMQHGDVLWNPDQETARKIVSITARSQEGEEPEPGLCANFAGGDYVALYNCELEEFVVGCRVSDAKGERSEVPAAGGTEPREQRGPIEERETPNTTQD